MAARSVRPPRMRRAGEFGTVPELKRKNPQSLRKVLYDISVREFKGNLSAAAVELKKALRTRRGRTLYSTLSGESLYNLLIDKTHIKYFHLEAYARQLEVPVSLLLWYSRLMANQHDGTPERNEAMLKAFTRIAKDASEKLNKGRDDKELFNQDDLFRWIGMYRDEEARAVHPRLFPDREE